MAEIETKILNNEQIQFLSDNHKSRMMPNNQRMFYHSLENPRGMKLLFRASENGFSAAKFYQACDNIEDTVIVVRTDLGKTIAAFTPLKWNPESQGKYIKDILRHSFLLSFDLRQKMNLVHTQYAKAFKFQGGTIFGSGYDLCLVDNCDKSSSYCNFPSSYNFSSLQSRSLQIKQQFCGSRSCSFKVLEYEVFQVVWEIQKSFLK